MIWNVFSWIGQSQPVETGEDSAGGGRTSTQSGGQGPGHDPESALISTRSSASLAGVAPQPGAGGPVCAGVPVLPPDLRQVERTAHASYHEDGLEEIFGGIIAVGLSLMLLTAGKPWLIQLALIPVVFLLGIARQRITYPRIGFSKPSAQRAAASTKLALGASVVLLALAALLLYSLFTRTSVGLPEAIGGFAPSLLGLYFSLPAALIMAGAGWLTGIARWYAYCALLLLCLATAWLLHADLLWGLGTAGVLIVLSGSIVLTGFIRSHPVLDRGDTGSGSYGGAR